jgi:hypothetical protein
MGGVVLWWRTWEALASGRDCRMTQPVDAMPATAVETEVERFRRYLEVSQATLEAAEQEM